jgi:uncharacterized protein YndB with AHSA1/START domain
MGLIVILLLTVVGIWAARTPFRYATTIRAPPERVYALVDDLRNWPAWSLQAVLDPTVQRTYEGAARGKGAIATWTSRGRAGEGRMEITDTVPNARVTVAFDLVRPGRAHSVSVFALVPSSGSTKLIWTTTGTNMGLARASTVLTKVLQGSVVRFFLGLFFSRSGGGSVRAANPIDSIYEKSLANIKAIAESADGLEPLTVAGQRSPTPSGVSVVPGDGLTVARGWRSPDVAVRAIHVLAADAAVLFLLFAKHISLFGHHVVMPQGPIVWIIVLSAGAHCLKLTYGVLADLFEPRR